MRNIQNILLTEKYRPKALEDLITPKRVGEKLSKGVYQHLLLHGTLSEQKRFVQNQNIKIKQNPLESDSATDLGSGDSEETKE